MLSKTSITISPALKKPLNWSSKWKLTSSPCKPKKPSTSRRESRPLERRLENSDKNLLTPCLPPTVTNTLWKWSTTAIQWLIYTTKNWTKLEKKLLTITIWNNYLNLNPVNTNNLRSARLTSRTAKSCGMRFLWSTINIRTGRANSGKESTLITFKKKTKSCSHNWRTKRKSEVSEATPLSWIRSKIWEPCSPSCHPSIVSSWKRDIGTNSRKSVTRISTIIPPSSISKTF